MVPVVGRLRKRPEFLKVAAARTKWVTPGLILQARQRSPQDRPIPGLTGERRDPVAEGVRVGFTVSRKVGQATERNRARRRLRAAATEVLPRHARPGYDYVLIGRRATLERPYDRLVDDLRTALSHVATTRANRKRAGGRRPDAKGGP
ncbi:MAG: ribonuclease P protein component [Alphaproteobacteria bacterium]